MSNYPPGVTGAEPQIAGYPEELFRVEVPDGKSWISNQIRHQTLAEAWDAGTKLLWGWLAMSDFRVMLGDDPIPWAVYSCSQCGPFVAGQMAPSHRGSKGCQSGSLASGGTRSHCTCDDGCF